MLCHLFNPISRAAQTITPLTFHSSPISEALCPNPLSINTYNVDRSLVSGAGQPTRHFNSEDGCPISEGTIRKGSKGLSPQGSDAFLTFSPVWLTAHRGKAFYWFLSFSTHIRLWRRWLLITPACSEKDEAAQLHMLLCLSNNSVQLFWKSLPAGLQIQPCFLCLCWFPQQLKSCWEVLSLQLDVVYRLSSSQCPQCTGHQAKVFLWELPESPCLFPPWTWVDSPPPQPSPTWLLRLKIAPAVLWCVLSSPQRLHSLHKWWMRHCFSSQCFSKLLWEHI